MDPSPNSKPISECYRSLSFGEVRSYPNATKVTKVQTFACHRLELGEGEGNEC